MCNARKSGVTKDQRKVGELQFSAAERKKGRRKKVRRRDGIGRFPVSKESIVQCVMRALTFMTKNM